ncbi:MAG: nucleotide-binding protein [Cytophagaceae bacterium]|nr:nucleotide-binding protein [Cytophagaceae bacterium]
MTEKIIPRFEILLNDLRNHKIGDFLVSRFFKIELSKLDLYHLWQIYFDNAKKNRTYIAPGFNHEKDDNINALIIVLNSFDTNKNLELFIIIILRLFIIYTKTNTDFSDVIEALKVAKFSEESLNEIEIEFEKHKSRKLPNSSDLKSDSYKHKINELSKTDIFIVHGHNIEIKEKVARTIEKLKLNPIILHEKSNDGLTIIEKLEKYSNVNFAVVLLTFDDLGNEKNKPSKNNRARQNVILELGYFIGKIGRKNVMPLYEIGVELPSDISGILYTPLDDTESWKIKLLKELKSAGFNVDANDIL